MVQGVGSPGGELAAIADVLARPRDFPPVDENWVGRAYHVCSYDFGCVMPEDYQTDSQWESSGVRAVGMEMRAFDPAELREPRNEVTRACWRLEQLGTAVHCRELLAAILGDGLLAAGVRCQAAQALASIGDLAAAEQLLAVVGDEVLGPAAVRSLHRLGAVGRAAIRQQELPVGALARSRVTWLLGVHAACIEPYEVAWVAAGLAGECPAEAIWMLRRFGEQRPDQLLQVLHEAIDAPAAKAAGLALAALALVRDPRLEAAAMTIAARGTAPQRQLALQYLGRVESDAAVAMIARLLRDASVCTGDRAAAALASGHHRAGEAVFASCWQYLLFAHDLRVVRATLRALLDAESAHPHLRAKIALLARSEDRDVRFLAHFAAKRDPEYRPSRGAGAHTGGH